MSYQPVKFLQAANIFLNHQLVGTGPLEEEQQKLVQNSTIHAFRNVIDAAREWQVDFVLLSGNSFHADDNSLGSRVELIAGLNDLHELGIPVIVLPGADDPLIAWHDITELPPNVWLLNDPADAAMTLQRDGNPFVQIGSLYSETFRVSQQQSASENELLQIAMLTREDFPHDLKRNAADNGLIARFDKLTVNYCALGGGTRETVTLPHCTLHDSGGTQGLHSKDVQERGCTLVEIDAAGSVEMSFIPTAVVRWESLHISIGSHSTIEELTALMATALQGVRPQQHERLWLVRWTIDNSGPLFQLIRQEGFRRKLSHALRQKLALPDNIKLVSLYRLFPTSRTMELLSEENPLAETFFQTLNNLWKDAADHPEQLLQNSGIRDNERSARLSALLREIDHESILGHAQQLGVSWFDSQES